MDESLKILKNKNVFFFEESDYGRVRKTVHQGPKVINNLIIYQVYLLLAHFFFLNNVVNSNFDFRKYCLQYKYC